MRFFQITWKSVSNFSFVLLVDNFPPEILSGPTEVNVTVNTTANLTVTAEDPNNDPMTFNVIGSLPKGSQIVTTASSVTLTWNVTADEVSIFQLVAVNRKKNNQDSVHLK